MRRLLLALGLLSASSLYAATYHVAPTGSGTTYSHASPGLLENILDGAGAVRLHPGDIVLLHAGTYEAPNDGDYDVRGRVTGRIEAPILITREGDEEAIIDCLGSCMGVSPSTGTAQVEVADSATPNQSTVTHRYGSVGAYSTGTDWVGKIFEINPGERIGALTRTVPPTRVKVISVTDSTHMEVTACPGITGPCGAPARIATSTCTDDPNGPAGLVDCDLVAGLKHYEYITIKGLKHINSSTMTRFRSVGHAILTNGSRTITWVDGSNDWSVGVNDTATVNTFATGNRVVWATGTKFCRTGCGAGGGPWNPSTGPFNKIMDIGGTVYEVADVSNIPTGCTNNCTELTLTTSPGDTNGTPKTAQLPNTDYTDPEDAQHTASNRQWKLDTAGPTDSPGNSFTYDHVYCSTATSCNITPAWAGATGTYEYRGPKSNGETGDVVNDGSNVNLGGTGSKFINNYLFDTTGGDIWAGQYTYGGYVWYGNVMQYFGNVGLDRGTGHGNYMQNPIFMNEAGRSRWGGNISLRSFNLAGQIYSENDFGVNSFITMDDNIYAANGHQGWPYSTWEGSSGAGGQYIGSVVGSPTGGCPLDYGWPDQKESSGTSSKTAKNDVMNRNIMYGSSTPFNVGSKGACNLTFTNNFFVTDGQPVWVNNGIFPTLTVGGVGLENTFMSNVPASGGVGGPAPLFNTTNFPNNNFYASVAAFNASAAGGTTDTKFYEPNEYEAGKGFAAVYNPNDSSTVTVDLCSFGGFVGEQVDLFNGQCADPWDCTPLTVTGTGVTTGISGATGLITACPTSTVVSATLSAGAIRQPGFTDKDGVTPFPKPPDIGPRFVILSLERDFGVVSGTPTPTSTNTSSPTPTRTQTFTPSPTLTFTPSQTPTNTATSTPTRTNTPSLTPTSGGPTNTPTFTPSNTPTLTLTPSLTPTLTPSNTPTPSPTPSGSGNATINVANCNLIAPMVLVTTGEYPGAYVTSTDGNDGMIECPFVVASTATYYVYAKTFEDDALSDSFFFTIDDADLTSASPCNFSENTTCTHIFDTGSFRDPNDNCAITRFWGIGASYKKWNDRGGGDGVCSGEGSRFSVALDAGAHTIRVRQRDADTRLYQIRFNTDPDLELTDPEPTPTPCVGSNCRPANCRGSSYSKARPCRR
jgi:hypothetical protein